MSPVSWSYGEVRLSPARSERQVPLHWRQGALWRLLRLPGQGGREPRPLSLLQNGENIYCYFLVMKFGQENYCSWMIFPMWFCELNCNFGTNFFFADQGTSRHPGRGPVTMGEGPLRDCRARSPHTFHQHMNCFLRFVI